MDRKKFFRGNIKLKVEPSVDGRFIIPTKANVYFVLVDAQRRFKPLKDAVLKILFNLSEFMAN